MNIKGLGDKLSFPGNVQYLMKSDIIMLSETWIDNETDLKKYQIPGFKEYNVYRKCLHSNATRSSGGVLIYIRKCYLPNVRLVQEICDHFAVLEIKTSNGNVMHLIVCYIPPHDTTFVCKTCDNNFYCCLQDLVISYANKGPVMICGDMNAHTGVINENVSIDNYENDPSDLVNPIVWNTILPERVSEDRKPLNEHGRDLLSLCAASGLRIMNGRAFEDNGIGKATFIKGTCRSVLDYLLIQEKCHSVLSNFSVGGKWPDTDHCPIHFELTLKGFQSLCKQSKVADSTQLYKKFIYDKNDVNLVRSCLTDELGSAALSKFYDSIFLLESGSQVCEKFDNYILQACERSMKSSKQLSRSKFPSNQWFDDDCKKAKSDYHEAVRNEEPQTILDALENDYKRIIQRKKREYNYENLSLLQSCRNQKELWSKLNSLKRKTTPSNDDLTLSDFYNFYSKPAIDNENNCNDFDLTHAKDLENFFENFVTSKDVKMPLNEQSVEDDLLHYILNATITNEEIMTAIWKLKASKSPGIDGVPIGLFKDCTTELLPLLNTLLNYMFEQGEYPDSWSDAVISPVPKVNSPLTTEQFRRISVLPAASKIYEQIINNRMVFIETAFEKGDQLNGGFKKGSRTSDNLFILNAIIEKYRCMGKPLFICFVDFKRAFDCVNRALMFVKLIRIGYSSKLLRVLTDMYSKSSSFVKWKGYLSKSFKDVMGVAQGAITSPFLFKSFLADLGKYLNDECGVVLHQSIITHLLWADDLFLVSPSADLMQSQLNNLKSYCSQWQMVVNTVKTKMMVFGVKDASKFNFMFGNDVISICENYSYLGNLIKDSRNPFTRIDEVVLHKCFKACYKIRDYVQGLGQLTPSLAVHFFNTLIAPILDYGSEIWYTDGIAKELEKFQKKYFKRNLSVRINTPDQAVFGEYGILPITLRLKQNVLKYIHRLNSLPDTSPVKWAYLELKALHDYGYETWCKRAFAILHEFEWEAGYVSGGFVNVKSQQVKTKLKNAYSTLYKAQWLSDINDIGVCRKLRTYKLFKTSFKLEKYLHIPNKNIRNAIARFRVSSHHLAIELGRHHKPIIPEEKRLCTNCGVVQDEIHHLLVCSLLATIREPLLKSACDVIPRFERLSEKNKFVQMMKCEEIEFLMSLGKFLIKADEVLKNGSICSN